MSRVLTFALVLVGLPLAPRVGAAQAKPSTELLPRAVADSTYAVRLELERLAEMIRRGEVDPRRVDGGELTSAAEGLHSAAVGRKRPRPHPKLGAAWDFQFVIESIEPAGHDGLRVTARPVLATDVEPRQPATLLFRRRGADWVLRGHTNLTPQLRTLAQRLARGDAR
jgi:hypothetical protein